MTFYVLVFFVECVIFSEVLLIEVTERERERERERAVWHFYSSVFYDFLWRFILRGLRSAMLCL